MTSSATLRDDRYDPRRVPDEIASPSIEHRNVRAMRTRFLALPKRAGCRLVLSGSALAIWVVLFIGASRQPTSVLSWLLLFVGRGW